MIPVKLLCLKSKVDKSKETTSTCTQNRFVNKLASCYLRQEFRKKGQSMKVSDIGETSSGDTTKGCQHFSWCI